jgi:NAD(P)-dependent dehydrogenase (short-subunit alcohol dehydrogenase family)
MGAYPERRVTARPLDLADKAALEAFCEAIEGEAFFGLVHNAGQPYDALAAVMAQDRAEAAMQVNFWSLTRIAKSVMRGMIRARAGRIVAIGSVAALQGNPGNAAYAASKGALIAYCRTLAMETAKRGVTVNTIAPGFIDTDMMAPYAAYREGMEKQIPLGRFAKPQEIAGLVAFLMSEPAAYITGAVLPVDGGLTAMIGVHR